MIFTPFIMSGSFAGLERTDDAAESNGV